MEKILRALADKIKKETRAAVFECGSLAEYTTYRVGGSAEYLVQPRNIDEARWICQNAWRERIPLTILGAGSNVIAPDEGIEGITLILNGSDAAPVFSSEGILEVEAGISLIDLAMFSAENGYSGFESVAGIPGTVGGAIMMNAGGDDGNISDIITRTEVLVPSGRRIILTNREMAFGYRRSIFQHSGWLIMKAQFRLCQGNKEQLVRETERIQDERRIKFPMDFPNAGSVFKRPPGDYPGRLIELAGCKGMSVGGAIVSQRHANFILNNGGAKSKDIMGLIHKIRETVYKSSGIHLELEQIPLCSRPELSCSGQF
ncbi:MAG: UDP-N-acetylmuramate dehydrogenase [Candidatus Krumholzibacteriota bacterium]|nr:UDP-N-acetylmuramate dehydrogenase [Candidatus Krumholzibacteriota bacterium]